MLCLTSRYNQYDFNRLRTMFWFNRWWDNIWVVSDKSHKRSRKTHKKKVLSLETFGCEMIANKPKQKQAQIKYSWCACVSIIYEVCRDEPCMPGRQQVQYISWVLCPNMCWVCRLVSFLSSQLSRPLLPVDINKSRQLTMKLQGFAGRDFK